jgi:hypothetical protein
MSKEKAIEKINQAIFLIKPYFEGNLEAKRFTLKYLQEALKELEDKNMDKEDLVIIDLFQGSAVETLYINNNRITPDEPMGMMKTICSIKVPKQFLISKLRTVLKELEDE